jgi:serine/threonine protein kinase
MADYFSLGIGQSVQSERGIWYRNIQFLGAGGNAVTFLILCTSGPYRGVLFALKVFRVISSEERKAKFLEEREFLESGCNHPSIMRVFDTGVFTQGDDEYPFVVSEYLPNTLADKVRERSATTVEKLSYTLQLLSSLEYLDTLPNPVVHRDIKPQNLFLKGQSCVLGDFGLMKLIDSEEEADRDIFKESVLPAMPRFYRTPDLIAYAKNEAGITTKSDVFQLGLVVAELFTGRNPAVAPPEGNLLAPLEMENLQWVPGRIGKGIAALIRRMLVIDPNERESASRLIDPWRGAFDEAIVRSHELEGRAF